MRKMFFRSIVVAVALFLVQYAQAQKKPDRDLRVNLNDDSTHYIKATFTTQVWARYTQNNPGSTIFGYDAPTTFDIGLRRVRAQLFGQISDRVFLYTQFGINNFNAISARKMPVFFHDALGEYHITKRSLHMGMGLTAWTGYARFSSPSVASIMGYDAPLFEQSTNDATDQFLRKLSVYAKGKLGKLDYRVIMSNPMSAQNSTVITPLGVNADFSGKPAKLQYGGYFMYQFLDEEKNTTPYMTGTYLGKKKVFNIGAGFQYQPQAMWRLNATDTVYENMSQFAVDVYYDRPMGSKGAAISAYAAFVSMDFGKGYLRNLGVMNPANGVTTGSDNLNGAGNAFPMMGTGNVVQAQAGYLLPKNVLGEKRGQLMPYVIVMAANFDRLSETMTVYDAGLNWFIDGYKAKLTLNYQNRPVFKATDQKVGERKSMALMQLQVAI